MRFELHANKDLLVRIPPLVHFKQAIKIMKEKVKVWLWRILLIGLIYLGFYRGLNWANNLIFAYAIVINILLFLSCLPIIVMVTLLAKVSNVKREFTTLLEKEHKDKSDIEAIEGVKTFDNKYASCFTFWGFIKSYWFPITLIAFGWLGSGITMLLLQIILYGCLLNVKDDMLEAAEAIKEFETLKVVEINISMNAL